MEINKQPLSINISTATVIKIILILLSLYFLFLVKDILAILFISLIFSSALDPWVDWLAEKKIPRGISMMLIYLILFIIVGSAVYLIIPPIAVEVKELANNFPHYLERIISSLSALKEFSAKHGILDNIKNSLGTFSSNLEKAAGGIFSTVSGIFGGVFSFFLVLVLVFYMVVEENAIKKLVWSIAPAKHQPYILQLINRMQKKIGYWLRGQLVLCVIVFLLAYIGLLILGVKYALVLALIAGLTEFIPYLGPIIGAIPAVFLAFTQSPMLALFTAILYYVIQLVENNILVPKIMERAVGLNPIISITVLLIGFEVGGIIGAILSIPVAMAVSVFIKDIFDHKEKEKRQGE